MTLEERSRQATEELLSRTEPDPATGLDALYRLHARRRTTRTMLVSLLVVVALVGGGLAVGRLGTVGLPVGPVTRQSQTPGPSPSAALPEGVTASIQLEVNAFPMRLTLLDGEVWLAGQNADRVSRIDPATNTLAETVSLGQEVCDVSPVNGDLLGGPCAPADTTTVVDPAIGKLRARIPDTAGPAVSGAGSIWVSDAAGTGVHRIDAESLAIRQTIKVPSGEVAFDGRFLWVNAVDQFGQSSGQLAKIDPATNTVVARYRIPRMYVSAMRYGLGALWFKPIDSPRLVRFDVATGTQSSTDLSGWTELSDLQVEPVVFGADSAWVRISDGVIARIDPTTSRITGRYPADPAGGGGEILVAGNTLWVTNYATATIWRLPVRARG